MFLMLRACNCEHACSSDVNLRGSVFEGSWNFFPTFLHFFIVTKKYSWMVIALQDCKNLICNSIPKATFKLG